MKLLLFVLLIFSASATAGPQRGQPVKSRPPAMYCPRCHR
jgi:hypothetical protein